jgi:hypothetical protein
MNDIKEKDFLDSLFESLPETEMQSDTLNAIMQKIEAEAVSRNKASERWGLAITVSAGLFVVAIAIAALWNIGLFERSISLPAFRVPDMGIFPYVGLLALLLLGFDHLLHQDKL